MRTLTPIHAPAMPRIVLLLLVEESAATAGGGGGVEFVVDMSLVVGKGNGSAAEGTTLLGVGTEKPSKTSTLF